MNAVDTNVIVRLVARDDEKQTQIAENYIAKGAWVSTLVLAESIWVLSSNYSLDKAQITLVISMLLEHKQLVLQDADAVKMALNEFQTHNGVGFTDCLLVAIAKKNKHIPVGTFDRKLAKLNNALALKQLI